MSKNTMTMRFGTIRERDLQMRAFEAKNVKIDKKDPLTIYVKI